MTQPGPCQNAAQQPDSWGAQACIEGTAQIWGQDPTKLITGFDMGSRQGQYTFGCAASNL